MKKFLFIVFFLLITNYLITNSSFAQQVELEECQKYYQFGEVKVNLNTKRTSYTRREKIEVFGTVVNENTFPLLNIAVYAHLRRINEDTHLENGHFLIDRLIIAQDLNFLPKETKELSADFEVKNIYPQGKYQLQYFVLSKEGFYYSGRPFLEEDFAGVTNFEIKNTIAPQVYFNLNSLILNGNPQKIREYIPIFSQGENPLIEIALKDLRRERGDLLIIYKWYRWDDAFEGNLVETGREFTFADQEPIFQTVFDLPDPGAYVLLLEMNDLTRSLFKFRIARRGEKADKLRMNDLGITNYPIDAKKDRAFVCFHSPSEENSPQTRVALSLLDQKGQVLEKKSIEDSFSSEVTAISIPLTKLSDKLNFSIEADFQNLENPSLSQKLKYDYDCHLFDQSLTSLSANYQDNVINLLPTNLCGNQVGGAYAEKLIIYQDGQIQKEEYNLKSIPSEIDTFDLSDGDYRLLVKSGEIEKEMEFSVGETKELTVKEPMAKKGYWWLIILGGLFLISLISLIIIRRRKAKFSLQGGESESRKHLPGERERHLEGGGIGEREINPSKVNNNNEA